MHCQQLLGRTVTLQRTAEASRHNAPHLEQPGDFSIVDGGGACKGRAHCQRDVEPGVVKLAVVVHNLHSKRTPRLAPIQI